MNLNSILKQMENERMEKVAGVAEGPNLEGAEPHHLDAYRLALRKRGLGKYLNEAARDAGYNDLIKDFKFRKERI